MNVKNDIKVIINNKQYTISGYESEEYLQKIALFLNSRYAALAKEDGYKHLDEKHKNLMLQINLADEYYKMVEKKEDLENQPKFKLNEITNINDKENDNLEEKE